MLHYWNLDTGLVTSTIFGQSPVEVRETRGKKDIQLVLLRGAGNAAAPVLLASGLAAGIAIRDPANLGEGYLGGPSPLTRGAMAADGCLGVTSTDTSLTRELMNVGSSAGEPESPTYDANAVYYYVPTTGGDPIESQPFSWTILPSYYRPGTPPADIINLYPSGAGLSAAVLLAATAEQGLGLPGANGMVLFSNTDGTRYWGGFPTDFPGDLGIAGNISAEGTLLIGGPATFSNNVTVTGDVTAATLAGNGAAVIALDASNLATGTVALGRLPAAVIGASHYKGVWNAGTNTPALASGVGETGGYYRVNVAGTTSLDGAAVWRVGDILIFDGTRWDKQDGSDNPLVSVNGVAPNAAGNVSLSAADVPNAVATGSSPTLGVVTATSYNGSGANLTGLAPFHNPGSGSINFTYAVTAASVALVAGINDASGEFTITYSGGHAAGTLLFTINFAAAYPAPLPGTVIFVPLPGSTGSGSLSAAMKSDGSGLEISAATSIAGGSYHYQYFIPIR